MTALSIIPLVVVCTMPQPGWCSQYGPGVMERVIETRQSWGQLPDDLTGYDGAIAVADCSEIGATWLIRPVWTCEWERFVVADCASRSDRQSETDARSGYEWMVGQGIVAEVDYQTALRWDVIGRGVRVEWARE